MYVAHGKRHCSIFVPRNSELHVEEHSYYSFLTPEAQKTQNMQKKTFVRLNRHFLPLCVVVIAFAAAAARVIGTGNRFQSAVRWDKAAGCQLEGVSPSATFSVIPAYSGINRET